MGFLFRRVQESGNKVLFPALASLVLVLTAFQLFQTRQFTTQAIHYSGTTAASYKENFLKLRPTHDSWQMLELPDFNLARLGIHVAYPTDTKLKEGWRSLSQQEAYSRIEEQIRSDAKLQRQIERYAQRDGIAMDSAMQVVLKRMHYRLCK